MSARIVTDNGKVICGDCGDWLIAKAQPDGSIHTWHRKKPCDGETEDENWERAVRALRGYESPTDRANRLTKLARKRQPSVWYGSLPDGRVSPWGATPAILPPSKSDPYRPRS